jgi:4-hydroxy-tetrahydrodipicolinate reductase
VRRRRFRRRRTPSGTFRDVTVRVCVAGITGWTGSAVAEGIRASADLELVAGVSRSDPSHFSSVAEALDQTRPDVVVDYTHAEAVKSNVVAAMKRGVAVVVGASGLTAADYDEIDALAREQQVGVVAAGNFSITAALLLRFATEAARLLEAWEVIDYASAGKPDAPSGTSRELAERLASIRAPATSVPVEQTLGSPEARGATVAGTQVHSLRLPSFTVSTETIFAAEGERLSIRHDAGESAVPYVAGTLLAIRALPGRVGVTRGLDQLLGESSQATLT